MNKRAWGSAIQNREERFELKRRAVLHSAARLIRRIGFEALSLSDIATDLHVSKPTIYYYFRNKEEIVRELIALAVAAFSDDVEHPQDYPEEPGLNGAQAFERFVRRAVRVTSDDVGASLFVVYPNQLSPDLRREADAIGKPVMDGALQILARGLADGSIGPCDPVTVYHFTINGLRAIPFLLETHRGTPETIADTIVALIAGGISPR
jgi:AcrR family transcriptional regulator